MSTSEHDLLSRAEAWLRQHQLRLTTKLEEAMSHLTDLIDNGKKLAAERADLITDRDGQKARADAAEAKAAEMQAKIDADDKTAADASDALAAEIAKEAGVTAVDVPTSSSAAPVTSTAPSGASVTVDPVVGSTTHEDAAGITTTLDHASGSATAVDASGTSVEPAPAAVAEAVAASADAGVSVPAAS